MAGRLSSTVATGLCLLAAAAAWGEGWEPVQGKNLKIDRKRHLVWDEPQRAIVKYDDEAAVRRYIDTGAERNSYTCRVVYKDAPEELRDFAFKTAEICQFFYPLLKRKMGNESLAPPYLMELGPPSGCPPGAAACAYGDEKKIHLNAEYFKRNIQDYGAVIHEIAHVVRGSAAPSPVPMWLDESFADYIRYKMGFSDAAGSRSTCEKGLHYTKGYWCGAAFLNYLQWKYLAKKNLDLKLLLTQDTRAGRAKDDAAVASLFRTYTGTDKGLDDLWHDCLKSDCRGGKP